MLQTCKKIAESLVDKIIDDHPGFSDFIYSEQEAVCLAIQKHWIFIVDSHARLTNGPVHSDHYRALVKKYAARVTVQPDISIFTAYLRLLVHVELMSIPVIQQVLSDQNK